MGKERTLVVHLYLTTSGNAKKGLDPSLEKDPKIIGNN